MDRQTGIRIRHGGKSAGEHAVALFIFIPFCKTLCTYCDFNVYAHLVRLFEPYVQAVAKEIERVAQELPGPRRAKSLAFGGGTPSVLPPRLMSRLFEAVRANYELESGAEITFEANPATLDLDGLVSLRELGVNRLSLGVQTFDDARLKALNRNHNSADSRATYDLARQAGFKNINLDLIFGLPGQTVEDWTHTLDCALAWEPEHLSLYGLQVEEGTALARQIARGRVENPDPDLAAEMFMLADEKLAAAGFEHYEISNYARPGFASRHNLTYWRNEPYLGFGSGAHSYFRGVRYSNLLNPTEYIDAIGRGEKPIATREEIGRALEIGETLMLGLRLREGIAFDGFKQRFGVDVRELFGETISQLKEYGLLELSAEGMRLTVRGMLLSNQALWRFLPDE